MRIVLPVTLSVVQLITVTAQAPANFSGRWIAIEPASVAGHELRITQDQDTFTVQQVRIESREAFDNLGRRIGEGAKATESTTYRLDGKPTVTMARGAGDPQQMRSSVRWDKKRLVLSDLYSATGFRFERVLSFDRQGRLVFERRRPPSDGEPHTASAGVLEPVRIIYEKR
ncbi:MAG TPA: hypothetical protein VM791_14950 [Vicinamibacterales bacterium]|nr:hypothetical protein [Vicinamibacterales bacterium]